MTIALNELRDELSRWRDQGVRPRFFWRDDDLTTPCENLSKLLKLSDDFDYPVMLAAIPVHLTAPAVDAVKASKRGRLAVHGQSHTNHATGPLKSEFPRTREGAEVRLELIDGRRIMTGMAGDRFMNVFVPPWGRIYAPWRAYLVEAGYAAISCQSEIPRPMKDNLLQIDCCFSPEFQREAVPLNDMLALTARMMKLRREADKTDVPIGIMTHHRFSSDDVFDGVAKLLDALGGEDLLRDDLAGLIAAAPAAPAADPEPKPITVSPAEPRRRGAAAADGGPGKHIGEALTEIALRGIREIIRFCHVEAFAKALPPGSRILFPACGNARSELALAFSRPDLELVCTDLVAGRYVNAERAIGQAKLGRITFGVQDLNFGVDPQFGKFDLIMVFHSLIYVDDPQRSMAHLRAALRPGGRIVAIEGHMDMPRGSPEELRIRETVQGKLSGFSESELLSLVADMNEPAAFAAYSAEVIVQLKPEWARYSETKGDVAPLFEIARRDLHRPPARSRSQAVGMGVTALAAG